MIDLSPIENESQCVMQCAASPFDTTKLQPFGYIYKKCPRF